MATTTSIGSTASHPKSRFLCLEDTRTRLGIIERALVTLHENNTQEVRTSRFFYCTYGGQQETDRFTQIFLDFFAYIRGEETLALEGAFKLLSCFGRERIDRPSSHFFLVPDDPLHYSAQPFFRDVYHEYAQYHTNHDYPEDVIVGNHAVESGYVKCMCPTEPVKKQLKTLLEKHQGLYRDFLLLLKKEHRALNLSAKIEDREIIFQPQEETISSITTDILTGLTFFLGSVTLFPKLGDTLKCIYARLLAIQWLKEDQRQLKQELGENVPPLKIPFTPNFPVIIDGTRYVICPTSPDGACALHALLGEKVDGEYRFRGDVRKHFIDTLKAKRQDPQVQSLFKRILKNHLHNAIDGRDLSSQMLFSDTPEGFRDAYYLLCSPFPLAIQLINAREAHLWAGEMDHNAFIREKLIQIAQQRREFSGKKSPQIVAKLKEDPFLLLNLIHPERTNFLNLLRHPAKKHFLTLLALEKEQVLASQSKKQDDFVLSDQIFERYLETVNQETFFFNTEEIELAAYLFGKKVQILALNGGSLQFSEYLFNPDLPEETTYIFQSGNHFSRCIPSNEISLAELNSLYNQAKGAAVIQRNKDERAEKILISTVKQEFPRLGISYGVSWIIGPAPMISQSINSAVTITSTYLDPFKESPLSAVTQVSASPILQLATGNSYAYVATSLSVDLGGRMFFDSLEERDMPEGFQRYALAAAKGFILRDEDILLSGLFNATVGLGIDQFRNRWESYFELNEAYWASDPAWGHCIVKGLWTTHCLQESLGSWLKQTADAFIKEDHPPIPRVFEISYSEGGTHLLTPLGEKTWSYEIRETWDTEHNSWTGKDKKINDRLSIFHIQKDASGNSIETKLDSVPNQAIGLAMIKLHEQAWNSYADFHEAASAFQQTLIDMGIPPGAIPPIQGLTQVHISIDFPSGSGKAKSYVTTVAGTTTWETEEKHKGNRPLKILEIHGVDPNKTHNQTTLKEYISQLKNLFGLEITTAPSHPLSLYSPFVEQEGKTYHVTGIGEHGEVLKLSKTTDSEEATVMSNRLVTFNAKVIEQNKQCMEMEQRLIDAGIPETSRPTFPQLETKPHKAGDFEVSYAQINASNIRNTQATTNYISQGNKLLDTPFEPQSLTPQEKQALIDSFSPHIPPEPTPLGFGEAVALGLKNVSTFLTDIGVESAQVSTSIPLYSAPKTSSPTFSENQIDLALSGGTPSQIVGHVTREGATFRTPPTPSPSSASAPSPTWTWEDLQAYEAASLFQTLNSNPPLQTPSASTPSFDPTLMATYSPKPIEGYHERQMEKAASGLPTDVVIGYAGPEGVTWKNPQPLAHPQMQESNPFSSLLAPKTQRPLIGSFSGEWNWQSFQVYQDALTMAAVEQAITDRNLALSSPKSLDFSDPSRAIESAHKEIWGEWFFDHNFEVLDVKPYSAADNSASSIPLWLRGFAGPDHLSYDPQERIEMNGQCLVAMAHSAGKIIGEAIDELRTLGSVSSSIRSDGKITLQFDRTVSQKIEGFLNEHLLSYKNIEGFHLVQNTSDIMTGLLIDAFATPFFARFLATGAHSLQGRSLITARQGATGLSGLGEQAAFLRGMNTPVYRSGFVSEKTVARLTDRQIRAITPLKLPSVQVGEELNWLSHNLPQVRQLQQVKAHRFDRYLKPTFRDQNISETQIRRVLNYSGFNTYSKPFGLPNNVIAELADKNGGMIYRLAGTTTDQNLVVRVCPGFAKESLVSSVMKRKHLNGELHGTLRQQTPYVVQRRGDLYRTIDGRWVRVDGKYENNKALTHIPLEIYEFKGW